MSTSASSSSVSTGELSSLIINEHDLLYQTVHYKKINILAIEFFIAKTLIFCDVPSNLGIEVAFLRSTKVVPFVFFLIEVIIQILCKTSSSSCHLSYSKKVHWRSIFSIINHKVANLCCTSKCVEPSIILTNLLIVVKLHVKNQSFGSIAKKLKRDDDLEKLDKLFSLFWY